MERKNMGVGKGKGYFNLVPKDPYVHSLSAKGIKSKKDVQYPPERKGLYATMTGKRFQKDFGDYPTPPKRGVIREIARKVHEGVDWAVEWEKEHLPQQKEWVKKEFNKAKEEAKKGIERAREFVDDKLEERRQRKMQKEDLDDVRNELDIDDDGDQDISLSELDNVNQSIKFDLENIDLDESGTPDYIEDGFNIAEPQVYTNKQRITLPLPTLDPKKAYNGEDRMSNQPDKEKITLPLPTLNPKKTFGQKTKEFVSNKYEGVKSYIAERKSEQEMFQQEVAQLSDNQLRELAVRTPSALFGKNKYEKELLRRIDKRQEIAQEIATAKNKALQKSTGKSSNPFNLGFLNPLTTLRREDK